MMQSLQLVKRHRVCVIKESVCKNLQSNVMINRTPF